MRIIATYVMISESNEFYKLHECIGVNNFSRLYYREYRSGELDEIDPNKAEELIENSAK